MVGTPNLTGLSFIADHYSVLNRNTTLVTPNHEDRVSEERTHRNLTPTFRDSSNFTGGMGGNGPCRSPRTDPYSSRTTGAEEPSRGTGNEHG